MLHVKSVRPMFTSIVTTADKFEKDYAVGGIVMAGKGDYKPWQTIVSVGDSVRNLKAGDKVMVNLDNYAVRKYNENSVKKDMLENKKVRYAFNFIDIDDENGVPQEHFLFNDRDILYSFEGEETEDKEPKMRIIMPKSKLIVN